MEYPSKVLHSATSRYGVKLLQSGETYANNFAGIICDVMGAIVTFTDINDDVITDFVFPAGTIPISGKSITITSGTVIVIKDN